ncbi:MAG: radical SAM protein [Candidatus Omnitrophica bacterium]|nr:radical SAM protein [Candidatus Omnitrophota bacterium]MDE2008558.1 radical SAM protein [Candidatus Omnitrophota bacterium]MDE2214024.1 radical SAM protein [Candidatus Omnitrophota bacterium]MDE2230998.1 radical SAM protein [Candidatus Omnitrophota bacterium]
MITKADLLSYVPPTFVRLSACSACQLACPVCDPHTRPEKRNGVLGWGYLRAKDFAAFIRANPSVKTIELSHSGEIFLNPELGAIIKDACEQGVTLTARSGVNFNRVSPAMCEDLVKYRFRYLNVAIDGGDEESYAKYRVGGSFTQVINNIKTLNFYKEKYDSALPELEWQFIPFAHNEHVVLKAMTLARELKMVFKIKLNSRTEYAPVKNKALIRYLSGSNSATRQEYSDQYGLSLYLSCYQLWTAPQINWDGKMTGCCANYFGDTGNVFQDGLEAVMKSKRYLDMKMTVLGLIKPGSDVPCSRCPSYLSEVPMTTMIRSTLKSALFPVPGAPSLSEALSLKQS